MSANATCLSRLVLRIPSQSIPCEADRGADECAILAQIDVIYPVALKYTGDDRKARLLTEKTVLAAMREPDRVAHGDAGIKSAMLSLLRTTYRRTLCEAR
jgi:hypothetical protein